MLLYHIRSHLSFNSYNQKIEVTLTMVWFGYHCKHTILIVSYNFWLKWYKAIVRCDMTNVMLQMEIFSTCKVKTILEKYVQSSWLYVISACSLMYYGGDHVSSSVFLLWFVVFIVYFMGKIFIFVKGKFSVKHGVTSHKLYLKTTMSV